MNAAVPEVKQAPAEGPMAAGAIAVRPVACGLRVRTLLAVPVACPGAPGDHGLGLENQSALGKRVYFFFLGARFSPGLAGSAGFALGGCRAPDIGACLC